MQLKEVSDNKCVEKKDKVKKCQYPNCNTVFYGKGREKYCKEHKKPEYFKSLYKKDKIDDKNNIIIKHDDIMCQERECSCALYGCFNKFKIVILPKIFIYPKYCPEHRNEHKRKMFLKLHS